jgi:hypothetical protein
VDTCASDADCSESHAICVPAGTLGRKVRTCLSGGCRVDTDCTAEPGGFCAPVTEGCCNSIMGLYCMYRDGCRSDAECPGGYCAVEGDRVHCVPGSRPCPR